MKCCQGGGKKAKLSTEKNCKNGIKFKGCGVKHLNLVIKNWPSRQNMREVMIVRLSDGPSDPCLIVFMTLSNPPLLGVGVPCDLPLISILQRQWDVTSVIPIHRTVTSILLTDSTVLSASILWWGNHPCWNSLYGKELRTVYGQKLAKKWSLQSNHLQGTETFNNHWVSLEVDSFLV